MIAYLAIAELLLYTSRVTPSLQHEALVLAWLMLQIVSLPGSEQYLRFEYSGNKSEKRSSNPSGVLSQKLDRPDMLLTSSGATVLVGEDKVSVAIWQCWFSKSIVYLLGCQTLT